MPILENSYLLPNRAERLTREQISTSLADFDYFTSNFQQIVTKQRELKPMKLNPFQQKIFNVLLPMIRPETRLNRRHNVILLKPRQVGASTGVVSFVNYLCSYVEGMTHLNILHTFPVGDTITKFYTQKVQPIITGVHPDMFPTIERETASKTSIMTHYKDLRGRINRDNYYELISANASSIRSGSATVWLADEVAFYRDPEGLEDAVSPALPDYGFSLVVYLSTFEDQKSSYFIDKIKTAMDAPDDWTLIFTPWYEMYPEQFMGNTMAQVEAAGLTDYDRNVIMPALIESGMSAEKVPDCIDWYHRKSRTTTYMIKEYPTTLDEVLKFGEDEAVFESELLKKHEKNVEEGRQYRLVEDVQTHEVTAQATESSPLTIYRPPKQGHRYTLVVDPITSVDEKSDYFAATMYDMSDHGQVAVIFGKNRPLEDWASMSVSLCKLYNRAQICPESNIAQAFYLLCWGLGYYNWYYLDNASKAKKKPGIQTTASTKENMINDLILLLKNNRIIIRDKNTIDQMRNFVRRTKKDGSAGKMEAKKGHHDDLVATLWIFAGMLDRRDVVGRTGTGWAI